MFAYGMLSVVIAVYLRQVGLTNTQIGFLFSLTLLGDTAISLFLTTRADRYGRRKTLMIGAALMLFSSVVFALTGSFWLLVVAATIGVLSPSGNEIGPFLPIEQAGLSEELPHDHRVSIFAWYNLVGYFAAALGSLASGLGVEALHGFGLSDISAYRCVLIGHGTVGVAMLVLYAALSPRVESTNRDANKGTRFGLHKSHKIVFALSGLFAIDAFAGGFVMQSLIAYWFHLRYGASEAQMGTILFFGNLLAGVSALVANRLAKRFGLVNTMVWTHIPSNLLLILVPLMPNFGVSLAMLLARFSLSQMDVPTRQAFVMASVEPDERSAAGGITNIARSVGVSISPLFTGMAFAAPVLGIPFLVAGGLKIVYDLTLWRFARRPLAR